MSITLNTTPSGALAAPSGVLNTTPTPNSASTSPRYYHSPFPGNPHKGGVVNVKDDVPCLPIAYRQQHLAKK
jgi:hypothetical protein